MKIHLGDLRSAYFGKEWTSFPENPREGQITYVNNELYIYTDNNGTTEWQQLSINTSDELPEGNVNLYYTNQRVVDLIKAGEGISLSYNGVDALTISTEVTAGTIDHGTLQGLQDDDHTHYLLADGSRTLSGDLMPYQSQTINLGSRDVPYNNVYTRHLRISKNSLYMDDEEVITWPVGDTKPTFKGISNNALYTDNLQASGSNDITLTSNIIPSGDVCIGTTTSPISTVHCNELYTSGNTIYVNGKPVLSDSQEGVKFSTIPNGSVILETRENAGDIKQTSGNRVTTNAKGGISYDIPSDRANKHMDFTNESFFGDIGMVAFGQNSAIQMFARDEIDLQAPTIYLVGDGFLNGKRILTEGDTTGGGSSWNKIFEKNTSGSLFEDISIPSGVEKLKIRMIYKNLNGGRGKKDNIFVFMNYDTNEKNYKYGFSWQKDKNIKSTEDEKSPGICIGSTVDNKDGHLVSDIEMDLTPNKYRTSRFIQTGSGNKQYFSFGSGVWLNTFDEVSNIIIHSNSMIVDMNIKIYEWVE